jgi:hypothetical protein
MRIIKQLEHIDMCRINTHCSSQARSRTSRANKDVPPLRECRLDFQGSARKGLPRLSHRRFAACRCEGAPLDSSAAVSWLQARLQARLYGALQGSINEERGGASELTIALHFYKIGVEYCLYYMIRPRQSLS